jgi:hypothetical protein
MGDEANVFLNSTANFVLRVHTFRRVLEEDETVHTFRRVLEEDETGVLAINK